MPPISRFLRSTDGRLRWEVAGRPFRLLGGETHNSAGSCLAHLDGVIDHAVALGCNGLIVPLSWELVEPVEGRFDLSLAEGILERLRRRGLRWVPLWFGAIKNTNGAYAPAWVKTDLARFPRVETTPGRPSNMLSVFTPELVERDARALSVVMSRLAQLDADQGTIIALQPENEVGILGAARDHAPAAEAAFAQQVPAQLLTGLAAVPDLRREVAEPWKVAGSRCAGTWSEVFGSAADEIFMSWHLGRYVGTVAAAARAAYEVPVFANAWLVQNAQEKPGQYPSGGPVAGMMDVWRVAAPAIDALAPDIYLDDFAGACADYAQKGNPLIIPEARRDERLAAKLWYAVGQHDCLGFAPFGIESVGLSASPPCDGVIALGAPIYESGTHAAGLLRQTYRLLGDLLPVIDHLLGTPQAVGILQRSDAPQIITLGGYRFTVEWTVPFDPLHAGCGGLIVSPGAGEFILAGFNLRVAISPAEGGGTADFLALDEGDYRAGCWIPGRRLNGDEAWLRVGSVPGVRRCTLYSFGS